MADSFIQRLRMNNIFGGSPPLGMPDFGGMAGGGGGGDFLGALENAAAMRHEREKELLNLRANISAGNFMTPSGQLQSTIANRVAAPISQQEHPMNVLFNPGISEYQRGRLGIDRAKLNQTGDIAREKLNFAQQDVDTRRRRAELAEKIADGRATDEEKHEYRMTEIGARGDITSRQIGERGDITSKQIEQRGDIGSRQIGERGDIRSRQIGEQGDQNLKSIAARTAGQVQVKQTPVGPEGEQPTQTRVRQANAAREFQTRNPELGKFISFDDKGNPTIEQPSSSWWGGASGPTPEQMKLIQNAIYGATPSYSNTPKPKEVVKPKEAVKSKSKYNVTIE